MAELKTQAGQIIEEISQISSQLTPLGVVLSNWPVADEARALLDTAALNDDQKEAVLGHHDHYFKKLQDECGYQSRDLIALHSGIPGLQDLLQKFSRPHTHDDDEVRYIVDGEGVFGFVYPDGHQVELKVKAGEYISVPKGTEHWFVLTKTQRIKAIRYFTTTEGWTPVYTDTKIQFE